MDPFSAFASLLERPVAIKNLEFRRVQPALNQLVTDQPALDQPAELPHFEPRLKHLINATQLTPQLIDSFCRSANRIRRLARDDQGNRRLKDLLAQKRAMLYFTQPSTRTFLSFMAACQILGITCNEVRDLKTSSEVKRESRMDAIRMFSSYFDVIIMRSEIANFAECCAYLMNQLEDFEKRSVPIINAGSGSDEHPTQALLDIYTLVRTFDFDESNAVLPSRLAQLQQQHPDLTTGIGNKTYLFCGDIGRGRTVRSLAIVLSQYPNVQMVFVSPEHEILKLDQSLKDRLESAGVPVFEYSSLDAIHQGQDLLTQVDSVYMTRIQREHNSEQVEYELSQIDLQPFRLTAERVYRMKEYAPILHPFPRDRVVGEVPTEIDFDPRVMYFRQARNGMWVRAALLVHLFSAENALNAAYDDFFHDQN